MWMPCQLCLKILNLPTGRWVIVSLSICMVDLVGRRHSRTECNHIIDHKAIGMWQNINHAHIVDVTAWIVLVLINLYTLRNENWRTHTEHVAVILFYMHESGIAEQCLLLVGLPLQLKCVDTQTLLWFLQRRDHYMIITVSVCTHMKLMTVWITILQQFQMPKHKVNFFFANLVISYIIS